MTASTHIRPDVVGDFIAPDGDLATLTTRQLQVCRDLVTTASSAPEIAGRLGISITTVRTHIRRIYAKLGIRCRRELKETWR